MVKAGPSRDKFNAGGKSVIKKKKRKKKGKQKRTPLQENEGKLHSRCYWVEVASSVAAG